MQIRRPHAFVVAALPFLAVSEKPCFYPDGKNATGLSPCYPDADVSHCCRDADVCLTNGLCFSSGLGSIVRRGCTDSSWKSDDCPNVCMIETFRSGDAVLSPCGHYNSFCCGDDSAARSCCDTGNATLAAQVPGGEAMCAAKLSAAPTTSLATTFATSTSATSPISKGASPTAAGASSLTSLKTGRDALIGLTVGPGCAALAAAALAVYWWREWKKLKRENGRLDVENGRLDVENGQLKEKNGELEQKNQRLEEYLPTSLKRAMDKARNAGGSP